MNSKIDDGGPAFPSHGSMGEVTHEGMSMRDYIAAKVIASTIAGNVEGFAALTPDRLDAALKTAAMFGYMAADAGLKARAK